MENDLIFKAGEAGLIAGVNPNLQRNWRNKGVLPGFEGERAKFPLREVCRFRLIRALSEAGLPLTLAATAAAPLGRPISTLAEATFARTRGLTYSRDHLMAVAADGSEPRVVSRSTTLEELQPFSALIVIDLDDLADELKDRIDLVGLNRRFDAINSAVLERGL